MRNLILVLLVLVSTIVFGQKEIEITSDFPGGNIELLKIENYERLSDI